MTSVMAETGFATARTMSQITAKTSTTITPRTITMPRKLDRTRPVARAFATPVCLV